LNQKTPEFPEFSFWDIVSCANSRLFTDFFRTSLGGDTFLITRLHVLQRNLFLLHLVLTHHHHKGNMIAVGIGELFFHLCRPWIEFAADAHTPQLRDHWQQVICLPLTS
jgi:hypothetical protein